MITARNKDVRRYRIKCIHWWIKKTITRYLILQVVSPHSSYESFYIYANVSCGRWQFAIVYVQYVSNLSYMGRYKSKNINIQYNKPILMILQRFTNIPIKKLYCDSLGNKLLSPSKNQDTSTDNFRDKIWETFMHKFNFEVSLRLAFFNYLMVTLKKLF